MLFEPFFALDVLDSPVAALVVAAAVQAIDLDDAARSRTFAVKSWRRSGRAIDEIARAITTGGIPTMHESD